MRKKTLLLPLGLLALVLAIAVFMTLQSGSLIADITSTDQSQLSGTGGSGQIRQTCPVETVFGQEPYQPDESWSFYTSDLGPAEQYKVYENFSGADGLDAVRFWGLRVYHDGVGWSECSEDPMPFIIEFYTDAAGAPGTLITSYTVSLSGTSTGLLYSGFTMYEWETPLSPPPSVGSGPAWISIQGSGDPACWLLWANSDDGDLLTYRWDGTSLYPSTGHDMAVCLIDYEQPAECDWQPGDDHKMHFPQLPDEAGWDVNATAPLVLADDFMCMETGPVRDVHFWGSWLDGIEGVILYFVISFHSDIPADPPDIPYSRPGVTLWEWEVPFEFVSATPIDPPTLEGWYDPSQGLVLPDNHQAYFQYNICFDDFIDEVDMFFQDSSIIYWMNVSAVVEDPTATQWGWKSSVDHWNDDAVWAFWGELDWIDLWEPQIDPEPISNMFGIIMDPTGMPVQGYGENPFDDGTSWNGTGWYFYPEFEWWNIWFYDHPFAADRYKEFYIEFDVYPFDEGPTFVEIAINWATDVWSIEQPPGDSAPPLPGVAPEEIYIGRNTVFFTDFLPGSPQPGHYEFVWTFPDYNPEWVSVDVRGYNFQIDPGVIVHSCLANPQSLDLAFVITNDEPEPDIGACCYPEPTGSGDWLCVETDENDCVNNLGGVWEGVGTTCQGMEACCLGDGTCVDADALCCVNELGGMPQGPGTSCGPTEACCFTDGACQDLDPQCCVMLGGTPQGPGTSCSAAFEACCMPGGMCQMLDPTCCIFLGGIPQGPGTNCTTPQACCMPGGGCIDVDPLCCDEMGGTLSPWGAPLCLGDANGNTVDDACEDKENLKWQQWPDLDPTGMDVHATNWYVLADDFECTQTGPITEIHIFGSWLSDIFPQGGPEAVTFTLSIHADLPVGPYGWSQPEGPPLWIRTFPPGSFVARPFAVDLDEGWFDPEPMFYDPNGDTQCWEYIFYLDEGEFIQQGSAGAPIVYWIDLTAEPETEAYFGWKTSLDHWNDDAVWGFAPDPPTDWWEMRYPPGHPFEGHSIDLAFEVYGFEQACDAIIGDANNSGAIDIDDVVYLIAFIFSGGSPPVPYAVASGDANCSCGVDIDDVVYLIAYIFSGGPPPCSCEEWVALCGPLH